MNKLFYFLFIVSSFQLASQNTLKGVVMDKKTTETLIGANVVLFDEENRVNLGGTVTNTEGEFLYKIVAKKAQANNADRQIHLDRVSLDYDGDQNIDWKITSEKGQLLSNTNVLALSGNVTVQSLSNENNMTTISTDYLEINPNTYTIATNRDVLIELDNNKIATQI